MCAAGRARGWLSGWVSGGWEGLLKRYKGGEEGGRVFGNGENGGRFQAISGVDVAMGK